MQTLNQLLMKDLAIANKKIKKVNEYVASLNMDLKDGTLKRVAPTKHPVQRLDMDAISEDLDETSSSEEDSKSNMNTSLDTDFKGINSTASKPIQVRNSKSLRQKSN